MSIESWKMAQACVCEKTESGSDSGKEEEGREAHLEARAVVVREEEVDHFPAVSTDPTDEHCSAGR